MSKVEPKLENEARETGERNQPDKANTRRRGDKARKSYRSTNAEAFSGDHEDLHGFVYTYDSHARANQYDKTTERVAQWVKKELSFNMDIYNSMMKLEEPSTNDWKPKLPENADATDRAFFSEEIKEYMLRKRTYANNRSKMYTIVLGQCSDPMKAKLEGQEDWEEINTEHNLVKLLKNIKVWMLNQQGSKSPVVAAYSSIIALTRVRQNRHESLMDYRKRFIAASQVLEHIEVDLGTSLKKIVGKTLQSDGVTTRESATNSQLKAAETKVLNRLLAVAFISGADRARYQEIEADLENQYLKGIDQYPVDVTGAYNRLMEWTKMDNTKVAPYNDGISFPQGAEPAFKKHGNSKQDDRCFKCGKLGHHKWENKCEDEPEDTMNIMSHSHNATESAPGNAAANTSDDEDDYEFAFCTTEEMANTGHLLGQNGEETTDVTTGSFSEGRAYVIPKGSVGLDSMSSVDVFGERKLLTNIRTVPCSMRIICNAGTVMVTQMGSLKGYGDVWYHPQAIANILSLNNVQKMFRVSYDSMNGDQFIVHRNDGTTRAFKPTDKGLYTSQLGMNDEAAVMVNTVDENAKSYTKREVKRAKQARKLMAIIGRPSEKQMIQILDERQLQNCDTSSQDVVNARNILGPDVGSLKGKTVRRRESHVNLTVRPISEDIMNRHKEVVICFDVMYVNSIAFLVSISRAIKFRTAEALQNRRSETLLTGLRRIKMIYARRGFIVNRAAGDNEFAPIEAGLAEMGIALNTVSRDEHVPEVERHIRTLKERCRSTYNSLPFRKVPSRMIIELVYAMTFWLHAFPAQDGVSQSISPRELVTGVAIDAARHCVIAFGTYVQTHEQHDNSMQTRTIGAIALRPSGNVQGGHFFLSLQTGRRIIRNHWTEVPMPADVIDRIHHMATDAALNRLRFGDREDEEVDVGNSAEQLGEESPSSSESDTVSGDDTDHDDDRSVEANELGNLNSGDVLEDKGEDRGNKMPVHVKEEQDEYEELAPQSVAQEEAEADRIGPQNESEGEEVYDETTSHGQHLAGEDNPTQAQGQNNYIENTNSSGNVNEDQVQLDEQMDNLYGKRSGKHNLRSRRKPKIDYSACVQVATNTVAPSFNASQLAHLDNSLEPLLNVVLTQYGVRKGLKLFGERGDAAVEAEMKQLDAREVMAPISGPALTDAYRQAALRYLMFLKQKRDGSIKGRGCADGREQRKIIPKIEASSPTISTEAVFLIACVAAKEKRDVASIDVPGAFLHVELRNGERVHVKFEGRMAEMLAMINPKLYRRHIMIEHGKPVLYAELKKALYGMLQSALKFWQKISSDLIGLGYTINEYDWCVANKMVNGKQHTIGWHVDDFLMTHEDPSANDKLIEWFNNKYADLTPLKVHRGKIHEYLGMTLDFSHKGKVRISMDDYIDRMVDEAPAEFDGVAPTPAAKHLFVVSDEAPNLDKDQAAKFHHIVAKALFLCKRSRPDIQLAVGFLCTRVREPDEDDWKKLRRVIQYLRGSSRLCLTLEADKSHIIKWWIDAAFAVHEDMRSQSGGGMSLGKGMVYSSSIRQKLNTRSSTEAELVGVHDFLPQVLWTRYFLEAQGYGVKDNIIHQDNQSTMLLANNGKASSSKRTRHINIRYFFITDRVDAGEASLKYCPTEEMTADFFTKPLQGSRFRQFRQLVLNTTE